MENDAGGLHAAVEAGPNRVKRQKPVLKHIAGWASASAILFQPQTHADINFIFSLADLAKENQHALRAKNQLDNCPYEVVSIT